MLTLERRDRTSARILRDGRPVGHVGSMAGGTMACVVLDGKVCKAHTGDLEAALAEVLA